jgi:hypothetical protein
LYPPDVAIVSASCFRAVARLWVIGAIAGGAIAAITLVGEKLKLSSRTLFRPRAEELEVSSRDFGGGGRRRNVGSLAASIDLPLVSGSNTLNLEKALLRSQTGSAPLAGSLRGAVFS